MNEDAATALREIADQIERQRVIVARMTAALRGVVYEAEQMGRIDDSQLGEWLHECKDTLREIDQL